MENYLKVYYENIIVGKIFTNKSMSIDEALEMIDFNEEEFIIKNGFNDIDYNEFIIAY